MEASVDISASEVLRSLRRGDPLYVLDVRPRDVYDTWHIEGSRNLPIYDELERGDARSVEAHAGALPVDARIVVVCNTGNKSTLPARVLREHGLEAYSLTDGMHGWGTVYQASGTPVDGVTQILRPGTGCLSYLIADGGEALLVDPGMQSAFYEDLLEDRGLDPVGVADTHVHADHVSGAPDLARAFDVPYYLPAAESHARDDATPLEPGARLAVGAIAVESMATPGHTSGSTCLVANDGLLSGDTLFIDSVGRPDLDGDAVAAPTRAEDLFRSLASIERLPGGTHLLPGHVAPGGTPPIAVALDQVAVTNDLFGLDDRDRFVASVLEDLPDTPANYREVKAVNAGEVPPDGDLSTLELGPNNCACR